MSQKNVNFSVNVIFENITWCLLGCHQFVDAETIGSNPHVSKAKIKTSGIITLTYSFNKLTLTLFQQQILSY